MKTIKVFNIHSIFKVTKESSINSLETLYIESYIF